uniref:Ig-like domain-containing protein n=1 Tax=Anopheles albimanus TaxID=7167 RepID=A0A182FT20_ANOAL
MVLARYSDEHSPGSSTIHDSHSGAGPSVSSVTSSGLRNLSLSIKPPWVRRGQEAQLHCQYEMEGAPLYSVKWYRGTLEFYRYSPFENPPAKIFPFTGIKVDNII